MSSNSPCSEASSLEKHKTLQTNSLFLAFDFGVKKIGVAVGQSITMTATPLPKIQTVNRAKAVLTLVKRWQPQAIIIGMPPNSEGTSQYLLKLVRNFTTELQTLTKLPIYTVNEHLTTKAAREELYNLGGYKALEKEDIDSFAAKLILESWLQEHYGHL